MSIGMMASLLIWLCGSVLGQSLEAPLANSRVDRVLAVVEESLVTEWDLRLEQALLPYDAIDCLPLTAPQADLLQMTEDRRILNRLAGSRSLYLPSETEVTVRKDALKKAMGEPLFLQFLLSQGLNEKELTQILRERITAERYIERNLGRALKTETRPEQEAWDIFYRHRFQVWMKERRKGVRIRRVAPGTP